MRITTTKTTTTTKTVVTTVVETHEQPASFTQPRSGEGAQTSRPRADKTPAAYPRSSLNAAHVSPAPAGKCVSSTPKATSQTLSSSSGGSSPPTQAMAPQPGVSRERNDNRSEVVRAWLHGHVRRDFSGQNVTPPHLISPPPPGKPPRRYYVVYKGLQTGIFYTWPEANERTHYIPGAEHVKFAERQQAFDAYTRAYHKGRVWAIYKSGSRFWPSRDS
ncbi:hypothetical protein CONPUDRAFT_154052 [Coniophora puteana RWD-64-598 SS2]|uniref:Ribonuclease H1 N-terminal domain-containing protein n=1 Tax=Coniophora puteana (strain RWD-64-598) TaxID=741705 RepID=A0A5M3MS87_CONPW|nr:uncharacterized protein CONPUDRAFT_154052 [Coniophora puteana RWD-64-598 SS2]EIW81515.1 hypothetical protein CONPUDRAFT_154052 [Coniophora puteana RWD-64-598 SS2]